MVKIEPALVELVLDDLAVDLNTFNLEPGRSQVRIWGPMHNRDSHCYRAIRTKLGDALRAQYDLSDPLPEPLTEALLRLDQPKGLDLDNLEQRRRFLDDER
jgi:hypothetical protein